MSHEKQVAVVVIDLETTGTDTEKHQILEIGARVLFEDGELATSLEGLRSISMGCPFEYSASRSIGAARVNGVWNSLRLQTHGDEREMLIRFAEWLGIHRTIIVAGINPHFDLEFLLKRGQLAGLELEAMFSHRVLDLHTLALAEALRRGSRDINLPSSAIYRTFGQEPEAQPHSASEGTRREFELFMALLDHGKAALPQNTDSEAG